MSERMLDDSMLIERAQTGDRSALDSLILKHEARAYQYAFRLTHNSEEASDVVAEAFIRVYNAIPNFKGQSAFTTWLYRILTNCFLDLRKKEKTRAAINVESTTLTADGEYERQVEDPGPTPHRQLERSQREDVMQAAVNELPEYQRAMITMYHAEMMSYDEIAAALDLPIGTVKSRLNRARLSLRDLLLKNEELFHTT